ncbi:unnamed protein product, partial [Ascophyllum nodosum]
MGSAGVIAEVVGSAVEGGGGAGATGTTSATDEGDGSWLEAGSSTNPLLGT